MVSTRCSAPTRGRHAASLNFIGAFLGTKSPQPLAQGSSHGHGGGCQPLVLAALLGAMPGTSVVFRHPFSSSHALIGGLMGAAVAYAGFSTLNGASIAEKILLPLILSPLAGFGMGFLTMFLIMLLCARANRNKLTRAFTKLQIVSAAFMATSHGLNDAQKTMGVITLALFIFNKIDTIAVPFWVKCVCALAMAMGTALGGWKIIKTMGHKIFKLEPVHGFATETSAAAVICGASLFGAPVSTTHTITACIFGVGSTKRLSAVRWGVAGNLVGMDSHHPRLAFIAAIAFWCMKTGG
ncbi:MAG: anion permease [Bilophila wadsworthia]